MHTYTSAGILPNNNYRNHFPLHMTDQRAAMTMCKVVHKGCQWSPFYSGTRVNGQLYKPDFWSIPVSKKSPKWSQYIQDHCISRSPSVEQPGSTVPRVTIMSRFHCTSMIRYHNNTHPNIRQSKTIFHTAYVAGLLYYIKFLKICNCSRLFETYYSS